MSENKTDDKQETPRTDAFRSVIHVRAGPYSTADWMRLLKSHDQLERELAALSKDYGNLVAEHHREVSALSATRKSVLEEAAKVCEQMRPVNPPTRAVQMQRETLDNAARLIRALKQTQYVGEKK